MPLPRAHRGHPSVTSSLQTPHSWSSYAPRKKRERQKRLKQEKERAKRAPVDGQGEDLAATGSLRKMEHPEAERTAAAALADIGTPFPCTGEGGLALKVQIGLSTLALSALGCDGGAPTAEHDSGAGGLFPGRRV